VEKKVSLKSCPFCGDKEPIVEPRGGSSTRRVYCDNCTAHGPWRLSREGAVAAWNRRKP
jgi:Lar family restriction alleviation protein